MAGVDRPILVRIVLVCVAICIGRTAAYIAVAELGRGRGCRVDNPLARYLGSPSTTVAFADEHGMGTARTEAQYLFNSQVFAESVGAATGVLIWVFLATALFACFSIEVETRCARCEAVLRNLVSTSCPNCGQQI